MPLSSYQTRLFLFLSVATFFEGYDFMALAQILPNLRADFALSKEDAGWLVAAINIGTILAYLLVRQADRWGRRPVLTVTITGYTVCSFFSGLAVGPIDFAILQLLARVFLIGEWAVAMVYAAEEFPDERRGMVIGVIQASAALGAIVCAGVVPLLLRTPVGWRAVYFVGAAPLVIIAVARRGLRETARFSAQRAHGLPSSALLRVWRSPYRRRILQMALIWGLTYVCTQTAIVFWKEFAVGERGFSDAQVGQSMSLAALASMPLVFYAGRLLDIIGRRWGAVLIFGTTSAGVLGAYTLHGQFLLTLALMVGIFGTSAVLPVLNAYNAELFPTELRADAFAWANNLLGRTAYVAAPIAVGHIAERTGWGPAVAVTAVAPLVALGLIWLLLPETRGRTLEETASME
ncbi:MAG: MFS transporter [Myxococcales bacterium]|nr:MFS transporter [Myxococcota bacterium]MDW8282488.1 MFS transporter [Myxococcales bacterium]